ncbi:hypothetical protein C7293_24140 [filamentous cyanobacterium CCT1]|nr:hypothetical protein C7293_24140 [filamentous cyanobacterium CCT1]PSN78652.1 hypothetical protein C8B47_15790 [filamentous cyanobacterium CCP4]
MVFNIHQLDNLDYDDAEPLLEDYIYRALETFANSKTGKAHIKRNPEGGNWIGTFLEMAYVYGGYTLPKMTKANVQEVMEYILPRKLTLLEPSDTDGAVDELVAFWTFIDEVYKFRSAKAIAKYLRSIETHFPQWMFDPDRGGIAKSFLTQGMAAGFDMTTQEGLDAFRQEYNRNLPAQPPAMPPGLSMLPAKSFEMTTAPPDMQRAFEQMGIELPAEGEMVNPMQLVTQFFGGLMKMDPDAAEQLMAELDDDLEPQAPTRRGTMAELRTSMLRHNLGEEMALSAADQAILEEQTITETAPGNILQDFQTALEIIDDKGIPVSGKRQQISLKALEDLNQRLSNPIQIDLKRPQQKSYPNIHGLYLLLRATGIIDVVTQGKQSRLVLNPAVYDSWQQLNPTEKYFSLLEVWFLRSHPEMLGEERSGPLMVGDRCLQSWSQLTKTVTFDDYNAQNRFVYYPGLENLALMEMFGLVAITQGQPDPGKGWRFKQVKAEPWGNALITLLHNAYRAVDYEWPGALDPTQPLGELQPVLQPYFPTWQQSLLVPRTEFRPGRHIFKVSLGKVWRRIAMPGEATLADFSSLILDSVEFGHDHLDQFTVRTSTGRVLEITHPYADGDLSTDEVKIGNLPLQVGGAMEYLFDFGDCWEFQIVLESIEPESDPESPAGFQKIKKTKTAKRKKSKLPGEILEAHGKAPEQYPEEEDW